MIIEAQNIRKSFGTLEVLKGVDFSAEQGEVVSIMGPSGAGKTTLLQILGTLSTPDSGDLTIDGEYVPALKGDALASFRGRRIGFVFQAHHLLPEFTALENVMIPALIAGVSNRDAQAKAAALLGEVGLEGRLSHKPAELSGGEQQRVAIARALINAPSMIIADEPTGNLDPARSRDIMDLLVRINQLETTVLVVTHEKDLVNQFRKRVISIEQGRVTGDGIGYDVR